MQCDFQNLTTLQRDTDLSIKNEVSYLLTTDATKLCPLHYLINRSAMKGKCKDMYAEGILISWQND